MAVSLDGGHKKSQGGVRQDCEMRTWTTVPLNRAALLLRK